jgi:hypothetical protein
MIPQYPSEVAAEDYVTQVMHAAADNWPNPET